MNEIISVFAIIFITQILVLTFILSWLHFRIKHLEDKREDLKNE